MIPRCDKRSISANLIQGPRHRPAVLYEFLMTLGILIGEYGTTIREGRRISGGAT